MAEMRMMSGQMPDYVLGTGTNNPWILCDAILLVSAFES